MSEILQNYRCVLTKYPEEKLDESIFRIEPCDYPGEIYEGQIFLKLAYISIDSYMRVRMNPYNTSFDPFKEN